MESQEADSLTQSHTAHKQRSQDWSSAVWNLTPFTFLLIVRSSFSSLNLCSIVFFFQEAFPDYPPGPLPVPRLSFPFAARFCNYLYFFFKTALLRNSRHVLVCTLICLPSQSHQHNQDGKHICPLQRFPYVLCPSPVLPPTSALPPAANRHQLSVMEFASSRIFHWNPRAYSSFPQHSGFEIIHVIVTIIFLGYLPPSLHPPDCEGQDFVLFICVPSTQHRAGHTESA